MEEWLAEVERRMHASVRLQSLEGMAAHASEPRAEWVTQWPAMVVLLVNSITWTHGVEASILAGARPPALRARVSRGLLWSVCLGCLYSCAWRSLPLVVFENGSGGLAYLCVPCLMRRKQVAADAPG